MMLSFRSRTTLAVLGAVLGLAACGTPLEPEAPEPPETPSPVLQNAFTLWILVADAANRVVPALDPSPDRTRLSDALNSLRSALLSGTVARVTVALPPARSALANYVTNLPTDEAELDAIRIAVDAVTEDLAGR